MNLKYGYPVLIVLILAITSCKKDEPIPDPVPTEEVFSANLIRTSLNGGFNPKEVSWLADTSSGYVLRISSNDSAEASSDSLLYLYFNKRPVSSGNFAVRSFPTYNKNFMGSDRLVAIYLYLKGKYYSIDGTSAYCKVAKSGNSTDFSVYYATTQNVDNVNNVVSGRVTAPNYE